MWFSVRDKLGSPAAPPCWSGQIDTALYPNHCFNVWSIKEVDCGQEIPACRRQGLVVIDSDNCAHEVVALDVRGSVQRIESNSVLAMIRVHHCLHLFGSHLSNKAASEKAPGQKPIRPNIKLRLLISVNVHAFGHSQGSRNLVDDP